MMNLQRLGRFRKAALSVALTGAVSMLSGCVLAPFIEAAHNMGVTPGDRRALLEPEMKKFNDARFWGSPTQALAHVDPDRQRELVPYLRPANGQEKVVESKLQDVKFSDDATEATASVTTRYYAVPFFVVKDRVEVQEWAWHRPGGWLLHSMRVVPAAPGVGSARAGTPSSAY